MNYYQINKSQDQYLINNKISLLNIKLTIMQNATGN